MEHHSYVVIWKTYCCTRCKYISWTFISYKIWLLTKCYLSSVLKTKALRLHQGVENGQAGPTENPQPPPSLHRGCQSQCRTTTQAAAQTSSVRFLPSVLHSDSYSSELKNGFSWAISSHVDKVHFSQKCPRCIKPTKHHMDSLKFF